MRAIDEFSHYDASTISADLLNSTTPFVLRGAVAQWPVVQAALGNNLHQYLQTYVNPAPVSIMRMPASEQHRYFYNHDLSGFNFSRERMNFDVFLQLLNEQAEEQKQDSMYLGSSAVDHLLPGMRSENDIPALSGVPLISLWLGNQSVIGAHYDSTHNLACVVAGERVFTLFPPAQLPNLYIGPLEHTPAGQSVSLVDVRAPDYERFPRYREAEQHALRATLQPGDAIFIPNMWWHHVQGTQALNLMINYWWRDAPAYAAAPNDALLHAILAIRDLPIEQRNIWRDMFEHYIFSADPVEHLDSAQKGVLKPLDEHTARKLRSLLLNKLNR